GEQLRALTEKGVVMIDANMLEHADRNDAVESLGDVAIILQLKAGALGEALFCRALVGDRVPLLRERDAGCIDAADFGQVKPKPAPAAADVLWLLKTPKRAESLE